ncbi:hypothetical protein VULLAG_LOCUS11133 [Vulpes lagopus]
MAPRRGCEPPHPTAASSRRPGPHAAAATGAETHVFSRRRRTRSRGGSIYPTPSTARSRVPRPEREPIRAVEGRSQASRPTPRAPAYIGSGSCCPVPPRPGCPRCRTQTPRSAAGGGSTPHAPWSSRPESARESPARLERVRRCCAAEDRP